MFFKFLIYNKNFRKLRNKCQLRYINYVLAVFLHSQVALYMYKCHNFQFYFCKRATLNFE